MKRAGSWILGIVAVGGMLAGTWIGLYPYLFRETIVLVVVRPNIDPAPFADAIEEGTAMALEEREYRAGRFKVAMQIVQENLWHFSSGRRALTVGGIVDANPGAAALITAGPGPGMVYSGADPGPTTVPVFSATDTVPSDPSASCTDGPPAYFRVLADDRTQGAAAADWARRLGATRALVVHEQFNTRSELIATAFLIRANELGIAIAGNKRVDSLDPRIPEGFIEPAPDLVFFSGEEPPYATAYEVFSELRKKGYSGTLMMAEASPHVSYLVAPGRVVEGAYFVTSFPPPPEDFRRRFREQTGRRAGPHNYSGYLAALAALDAIERANSRDPAAIRAACAALGGFDAKGDTADNPPSGYVVKNGAFEFVEPLE